MSQTAPPVTDEDREKISSAGFEIYNRKLKALLEPDHLGEVVAIHLDSEDYEVAPQSSRALSKLRGRHPEGLVVIADIGPVGPINPLAPWLRAEKCWQGDIKNIPAKDLDALISMAANEAAEDYRKDPELRAFHSLDGEDFIWDE